MSASPTHIAASECSHVLTIEYTAESQRNTFAADKWQNGEDTALRIYAVMPSSPSALSPLFQPGSVRSARHVLRGRYGWHQIRRAVCVASSSIAASAEAPDRT
jgi:hypothetical protein